MEKKSESKYFDAKPSYKEVKDDLKEDKASLDDGIKIEISSSSFFRNDEDCKENEYDIMVLTSVRPPERGVRHPANICCVIDVSGSMAADASVQGTEGGGLAILDIVKHAVKTIVNTLDDNDQLALVSYSTTASGNVFGHFSLSH